MKYFISLITILIYINGYSQDSDFSHISYLIDQMQHEQALMELDSMEITIKSELKPVLYFYKAVCYYDLEDYSKSIDNSSIAISSCLSKDTLLQNLYLNKIHSYIKVGDYSAAIKNNKEVIKLFPNNINNYMMLSYLYGSILDYNKCLRTLDKAIKIESNNPYVFNNLSYYSTLNGDYDLAIKYANAGLDNVKDNIWKGTLLNNRGFAYLHLQQYDKALIDINESIKLFPTNTYAYYNKVLVSIQTGDSENICINLKLAKELGAVNLTKDLLKKYCE